MALLKLTFALRWGQDYRVCHCFRLYLEFLDI